MLVQLHIQHFALMDNLTIEFDSRLNVLTGETGAGKSILIDAIRFILGERMDSQKANASGKTASVEAVFDVNKNLRSKDLFSPYFENDEDVLIFRREFSSEGKSRAWINGRVVNVSALKELGSNLIDIHGQYDHQLLLDQALHLGMLDRFIDSDKLFSKYRTLFEEYSGLIKKKEELTALKTGRDQELDYLTYQVQEIEQVKLSGPDEEEELKREHAKMANAEKLYEAAEALVMLLDEDERSVTTLLGKASARFSDLVKYDDSMHEAKKELESAQLALEEIARTLQNYRDNLSFDPDRLKETEARLDSFSTLKRKYGGSLAKVIEFYAEAKEKRDALLNTEVYSRETDKKIKKLLPRITNAASKISKKRKEAAVFLKNAIQNELKDLGIEYARFECHFEEEDFSHDGKDRAEFLISPNPGQPLLPLRKIISAGEVARVMLAMKKALSKVDEMETLIFDEIDSNIGGRMGTVTGEKLREIANDHQVLLITHLPQIASFADRHFKVTKAVRQGNTVTEYHVVEGAERVKELSEMMSGKAESEISRRHAEEMLLKVDK